MEVLKWKELSMRTSEGRSRYCGEGVRVAAFTYAKFRMQTVFALIEALHQFEEG